MILIIAFMGGVALTGLVVGALIVFAPRLLDS